MAVGGPVVMYFCNASCHVQLQLDRECNLAAILNQPCCVVFSMLGSVLVGGV